MRQKGTSQHCLYLLDGTIARLRSVAKETRLTQSAIVESALASWFEEREDTCDDGFLLYAPLFQPKGREKR